MSEQEIRTNPEVSKTENLKKNAPVVLMLLLTVAILTAGYFYKKYSDIRKNPQSVAQNETKALIAKVGKLIELPADEEPTIATVSDLEPLKGQAFFEKAKIGFKVLIYTNAKKAILYDPEINKIIEVAPVNTATNSSLNSGTTPVKK